MVVGLFLVWLPGCDVTAILWHSLYRPEGLPQWIMIAFAAATGFMLGRLRALARTSYGALKPRNTELEPARHVDEPSRQLEDAEAQRADLAVTPDKAHAIVIKPEGTIEAAVRALFENASQGILTTDRHDRIVDANAMVRGLFGYSRAELMGAPVAMVLPEGLRTQAGRNLELVGRRKDGSEFPADISLSYQSEHQSGLAMAFISDITARQQADGQRDGLIARLEGALAEKTVLIKEVHHRVKNNLAVIIGLLETQADTLTDERARVALNESQQRLLSIALIHEHLYATEHLDRVNFDLYLEQLATELASSYVSQSGLVRVIVDAEEIELPVDRAIASGLILNELLSNAFKYAFPGNRAGQIRVSFSRLEPGWLMLAVADDGVGIPDDFDWQNPRSLGLRIVRILTKQLGGELTLHGNGGGTRFELRFHDALPRTANQK